MANILDILNEIGTAIYGRDVRQAIIDAIRQCYEDGKAGVNDLQARTLIEAVMAVNEQQAAEIETLTARVEELEEGGSGGSSETSTTSVPTFLVESGIATFENVGANKTATQSISFTETFTEAPTVLAIKVFRQGANTFYSQVTAQPIQSSITSAGFTLAIGNKYTQAVSPSVLWVAFQPTTVEVETEVTTVDGMSEADVRALLAPIIAALDGLKIGYDGTEYDTAGGSLREQINDLHVLIGDTPGTAIQASAVAYGDSDVGTELTNVNGRLQDLNDVLGIDTREGTAFDFTDEEYSAGARVELLNVIDVPLTNCLIKSITLAMNTSKALNCMIYVVKSDLTVVKTIEGTSESAGLFHTVSIDYEIDDDDTYYIGLYATVARAITISSAQETTQTNCYEFDPSTGTVGALSVADKRRIRASLLIETTGVNKVAELESNVEGLDSRVTALENGAGESLPAYYDEYLPAKITTLLSLDAEVGSHGDSFVFMTDYHDTSNTGYSPEIIKRIVENTATKMIVFGGDVINQYATKEQAYPHFADFHKRFLFSDAYYPIIGNHEYNDPGNTDAEYTGKRMTFSEAYGMNLRQKEVDVRYKWDGGYVYHVDNEAQKIRYYMIGCNATSTIEAESRNAFFASLLNLTEDYTVIVIAHQLAAYNNGNPAYGTAGQLIATACDAFNGRYSFTANGITYDYSNATGKVILLLQGHTHVDFDLTSPQGIPSVCTTCDTYAQQIGSLVRTAGTVTEQAFDVVHINTDTKTIKLTRIGAGTDRVFTYA